MDHASDATWKEKIKDKTQLHTMSGLICPSEIRQGQLSNYSDQPEDTCAGESHSLTAMPRDKEPRMLLGPTSCYWELEITIY